MEDDYDQAVRIYTFDPDTLEASLAFEYPFETEGGMGYMTYVTDHYVYCAVYLEDGEISTELVSLDVQKQKATTLKISDIDFGYLKDGLAHLFLNHNQGLYLYAEKEERIFELESPSFVNGNILDNYYNGFFRGLRTYSFVFRKKNGIYIEVLTTGERSKQDHEDVEFLITKWY